MIKRKRPEKEVLERLHREGKSQSEIARILHVSQPAVSVWFREFGLKTNFFRRPSREWLYHQYVELGQSLQTIAEKRETTVRSVYRWLDEYGIPIREWHESQANHVQLSSTAIEFISGELLGDMSLVMNGESSARIDYSSQYKSYLLWLSKMLSSFGISESGIYDKSSNGKISFQYHSRSYRELGQLRQLWYPNGAKRVPGNLKLTPLICRQWLIGDGYLRHARHRSPAIVLATYGFSLDEIYRLSKQLNDLGFKSTVPNSAKVIYISSHSVADFLGWIGPCPEEIKPWYGYKWALNTPKTDWIENIRPRLLEQSFNKIKEKGGD